MNGKCAKRIRNASGMCGRDVRELKDEYRALPYHKRGPETHPALMKGIPSRGHSAQLRFFHRAREAVAADA